MPHYLTAVLFFAFYLNALFLHQHIMKTDKDPSNVQATHHTSWSTFLLFHLTCCKIWNVTPTRAIGPPHIMSNCPVISFDLFQQIDCRAWVVPKHEVRCAPRALLFHLTCSKIWISVCPVHRNSCYFLTCCKIWCWCVVGSWYIGGLVLIMIIRE